MKLLLLLSLCLVIIGCATLAALQKNPSVQAAETDGITIGLDLATKSPAFGFVAPIAVNGLTALADNYGTPTAVSGVVAADAPLIVSTVKAAIPNSAGVAAATAIATAYTTAMAAPGVPQTTTGANAVIAAIASGLTTGATQAATAAQIDNARRVAITDFQ